MCCRYTSANSNPVVVQMLQIFPAKKTNYSTRLCKKIGNGFLKGVGVGVMKTLHLVGGGVHKSYLKIPHLHTMHRL